MGLLLSATAIFLASLEWSRAPESSNDVEARGQLDRTAIVPGWTPRADLRHTPGVRPAMTSSSPASAARRRRIVGTESADARLTGNTYSAKAWCARYPPARRYQHCCKPV